VIAVVDASAIASILVPEVQTVHAERLLDDEYELLAPDHLQIEIYSVLLRALRRDRMTEDDVAGSLVDFRSMPITFLPSATYLDAAFVTAKRRGGSVYDALYVAAARVRDATVVTNDRRLADMARAEAIPTLMVMDIPPA
jgi:predicted nucleic acid-binding protein